MFDVAVRPRELLKWEIAPEFAIEAIPGDASESESTDARVSSGRSFVLRAIEKSYRRGSRTWECGHTSTRGSGSTRRDRGRRRPGWRRRCGVLLAADVPRLLRVIPGFSRAATMTIGTSIDIVRGGISEATQRTYDAWAARRGATTAAGIEKKT